MTSKNWTTVAESSFPWEREALEFVRSQFPSHDPYRAWSNFEFIADDGSVNEVDLLVFTPHGFFLIEIKSRPGRLWGDAGTWTWESDGKLSTTDNPLLLANLKAKKLRSLLQKQKAFKNKGQPPFIEAIVFCSAPNLNCELQGNARHRVVLRDRDAHDGKQARKGIIAAIMRRECSGLDPYSKGTHDRPMMKVVSQAIDQAGIRPNERKRKVNDYQLNQLIDEGPGYQDWLATHSQVNESKRRVRLYLVRTEATEADRATIRRAALREFQILETLEHPGILRASGFTEHELGPALLFEHDPQCVRLDHYLAQQKDKLSVETQLDLIRQIAEVVRYAHEKRVIHRGLCPRSILVSRTADDRPRVKVFNWQVGYRNASSSSGVSLAVSATSHVDRLVDDTATAYMAPESLTEREFDDVGNGEHLDVFSLGAIAYHIFSGVAPAANAVELSEKLRETRGLQISSVMNGASEWLQEMVRCATHPVVPDRVSSVTDFLGILDEVESELTESEHDTIEDPSRAQKGDVLPGGYTVVRRLGQGGCSVALLVEKDGQDYVLKVANDPSQNQKIADEAEVLCKDEMRHTCIVDFVAPLELGQYRGFLMRPVYAEKEKRIIETLGHRLRTEGRLSIDLLQRFGDDLLGVVNHLEDQGIPHKDIKPDNIAVGMVGRGSKLHLVLFDFSLSRTPAENVRAGTSGYLDPMLPLRKPARWDLHAERYSAAMTLYELATGTLAKWGDGTTDPSHLNPTTEITIDSELFDSGIREPLTDFFAQAFRRDIAERFDNAEVMLRAWQECFTSMEENGPLSDHTDGAGLEQLLANATFDTTIAELGLGTRASNVLDRANLLTVEDLLTVPMRRLLRLRGVGNKTRREIAAAVKILRELLGKPHREQQLVPDLTEDSVEEPSIDVNSLSVDLLADRLLKTGGKDGESFQRTVRLLLGVGSELTDPWPSQATIAELIDVTRGRVGQIVGKLHERWSKDPAVTRLRTDLAEMIAGQGGVMSAREISETLLVARGSSQDDPLRSELARAVVRAGVEVERSMVEPRFMVRRDDDSILIATNSELAGYARRLGAEADSIASEDPLLASNRVIERLREVAVPAGVSLSDTRLVRLAAESSSRAAVSSRGELYPVGMRSERALKLSQGAVLGQRMLTASQIAERVSGRYPQAEPLPDRPSLDQLLRTCGFDLVWDEQSRGGSGAYVSPLRDNVSLTGGSQSLDRHTTRRERGEIGEVTPEEADARQFEERLERSIKEGAFLTLMVHPKYYERAQQELCRRFPLRLVDLEGVFLDALTSTAADAKVNWELVLQTDGQPNQGEWDRLMLLVKRAMPNVEHQLSTSDQTILVIYPGLISRYDQMDMLSRLSQKVGRHGGIPGLWLLLPGDTQAMIDGKPVSLIGPGQRARIPESWLQNLHRGGQPSLSSRNSSTAEKA